MNFGELVARVRRWRATSAGTEATEDLTYIKDTVNSVYRELLSSSGFIWQDRETVFDLRGSFSDGALLATNGASIVTLHSTSTYTGFTCAHWGGKVQIGTDTMYYVVERTSLGEDDPHYAYLDRPFQGVSTESVSYELFVDQYPLPGDFRKAQNCRLGGASGFSLTPINPYEHDRYTIHSLQSDPVGDPTCYSIWKQRYRAWVDTTCTVTNGNRFVDMEEEGWKYDITNWNGRSLEFSDGERYRVLRQNNSSPGDKVQLELDRAYGGTSATSTAVSVDPVGTPLVQFFPVPSSANTVVMKYVGSDHDLVNDSDTPNLSADHHDAIWKGAIYHMAQFDREIPQDVLDRLFRDFMSARARLEGYRTFNQDTRFQRKQWGRYGQTPGLRIPSAWSTS